MGGGFNFENMKTSATFIGHLKDEHDLSWAMFYEKYSRMIINFALKRGCAVEQAEDVLQETVMALLDYLPQFEYNSARGKFRSLLFRITESKVVDAFRRDSKVRNISMDAVEGHNDHGRLEMSYNSVDEAMRLWDQAWEEEILQYAVKEVRERVKPRTFECFRMVFLEKIPVKKTAEKMGISANLVSQHKHKVMHLIINTAKKIRKILEE